MSRKEKITEPRGTHFTLILSRLAMLGDIAEARRGVGKWVIVVGGKVVGEEYMVGDEWTK